MTELQTCPKCGGRLKFGRVKQYTTFTEKRRDCTKCPYGDKVHVRIEVREELLAVLEIARRAKPVKRQVRVRTLSSPQTKNTRNNRK
jgi:hypothetical protein